MTSVITSVFGVRLLQKNLLCAVVPFMYEHDILWVRYSFTQYYLCLYHAGVWDVVVTCFFIDTAHNIVEYIEIISRILKEGGVSSLELCLL